MQATGTELRLRGWVAVAVFICMSLLAADDPFADVVALPVPEAKLDAPGWQDNLLVRREIYALFGAGCDNFADSHDIMSRLSLGFELQKRFATATRTVASVDYQGRLVYRAHPLDVGADHMAMGAARWKYETHNAYFDFYNVLGDSGQVNLRGGYFYQPFGLSQQSDTHGTLLQLDNDAVFGASYDWQLGLWGVLNRYFDYSLAYLFGTGMAQKFDGQAGLLAARLALNNEWLFKYGLEAGVSVAAGERVDSQSVMRSAAVRQAAGEGQTERTWRAGADVRQRFNTGAGTITATAEGALGEDEDDFIAAGLAQAEWLHPGRRWGAALQYRHFWQDVGGGGDYNEARAAAVVTHYLRNDVGSANLHWIAIALERNLRHTGEPRDTVLMLQYYRYW